MRSGALLPNFSEQLLAIWNFKFNFVKLFGLEMSWIDGEKNIVKIYFYTLNRNPLFLKVKYIYPETYLKSL